MQLHTTLAHKEHNIKNIRCSQRCWGRWNPVWCKAGRAGGGSGGRQARPDASPLTHRSAQVTQHFIRLHKADRQMSGRSDTGSTCGQTQPDIRTVHMVKQGLGHIMKVHTGIFSGPITITGTQLFLTGHMTTLLNDNHKIKIRKRCGNLSLG